MIQHHRLAVGVDNLAVLEPRQECWRIDPALPALVKIGSGCCRLRHDAHSPLDLQSVLLLELLDGHALDLSVEQHRARVDACGSLLLLLRHRGVDGVEFRHHALLDCADSLRVLLLNLLEVVCDAVEVGHPLVSKLGVCRNLRKRQAVRRHAHVLAHLLVKHAVSDARDVVGSADLDRRTALGRTVAELVT